MFIGMNLGDVKEPKPVAPGRYHLIVTSVEYRKATEPGKGDNIKVNLGIEGHEDAPNVTHFISMPKPDDDPDKAAFKKLMMKRFLTQFGAVFDLTSGFELSDLNGCHGDAQLDLSDPSDSKDGKTVYNRLVLDKMAE